MIYFSELHADIAKIERSHFLGSTPYLRDPPRNTQRNTNTAEPLPSPPRIPRTEEIQHDLTGGHFFQRPLLAFVILVLRFVQSLAFSFPKNSTYLVRRLFAKRISICSKFYKLNLSADQSIPSWNNLIWFR